MEVGEVHVAGDSVGLGVQRRVPDLSRVQVQHEARYLAVRHIAAEFLIVAINGLIRVGDFDLLEEVVEGGLELPVDVHLLLLALLSHLGLHLIEQEQEQAFHHLCERWHVFVVCFSPFESVGSRLCSEVLALIRLSFESLIDRLERLLRADSLLPVISGSFFEELALALRVNDHHGVQVYFHFSQM